ncbi:MAG TPA: DUF1906 domain-containing protein [Beijerinckiaceae bacterium]|jgi:hypothetical protein
MALPGTVVSAPSGRIGFDTDRVLDRAHCHEARRRGFDFCLRYVPRGARPQRGDLTVAEARIILDTGLALMPVQHVARSPWSPSKSLGEEYGRNAAAHVERLGFPGQVNVWVDLEGIRGGTPHSVVTDYCNAWLTAIKAAGFSPGVYVGANAILSGAQLEALHTEHFWKSGSRVPDIPRRGYQLIQTIREGDEIDGIGIDRNRTVTDRLGGAVLWLAPA